MALVKHMTSHLGHARDVLARQAEAAIVGRYSATMLDIVVPSKLDIVVPSKLDIVVPSNIETVDLRDGPTPGRSLVYEGDRWRTNRMDSVRTDCGA
ncbi:hypothetical protein MyNCGM70_03880 [Achromobacter xylosoxidans]